MKDETKVTLDLRGELIPLALLKFTETLRETEADRILEVLTEDDTTISKLLMVLQAFPHEIISMERDGPIHRILLRKKAYGGNGY